MKSGLMPPFRKETRFIIHGLTALAGIVVATAAIPAPEPERKPALAAGDATRGRRLFDQVGCSQCHGTAGQGAVTGPRLAPDPKPYNAFSYLVRHPVNQMPAYSPHVLTEGQVGDIYAYLSHLPKPRPADRIPMLDALRK